MRELSCATRSSPDFGQVASLLLAAGGLQNSFGGAEQPRMIELLVYNVGGQLVLRGTAGHCYQMS